MLVVKRADYSKDEDIIRDIRTRVFTLEQNVNSDEDFDGLDSSAIHVIAYDGKKPIGTARMLELETGGAKLGRMAVLKRYRGMGAGKKMAEMLVKMARAMGMKEVEANSQVNAMGFYEKLGFKPEGPIFKDAGIDHRKMRLKF
ncbi:hypothetical protein DRN67_02785 [Candidatus Micrarchaeota archaeon]|nr:MAG: hypothetical protein DRN67_02785 [Candidatus Micrarchaeota archaeon]